MNHVFYAGVWLVSYAAAFFVLSSILDRFRKWKRRNNKDLWMRAGVTLKLTDDEVAAIFAEGGREMHNIVTRALQDGRFEWDGDSYIPALAVEIYNERYGTNYKSDDYGVDL